MAAQSISGLVGGAPRKGPEGAIDALLAVAAADEGHLQLTHAPHNDAGQFDGQYVGAAHLPGHASVNFRVDVGPQTTPRVWAFDSAFAGHDETPGVQLSAAEVRVLRLNLERLQPETRIADLLATADNAVPQKGADWFGLDAFEATILPGYVSPSAPQAVDEHSPLTSGTLAQIRAQTSYEQDLRNHRTEAADFAVEQMDDGRTVFKGRPGGIAYREALRLPEGVTLQADGETLRLKLASPISYAWGSGIWLAHAARIEVSDGSNVRCRLEAEPIQQNKEDGEVDRHGRFLEGGSVHQVLANLLPAPELPVLNQTMLARIASARPGQDPQLVFQEAYKELTNKGNRSPDLRSIERDAELAELLSAMSGGPIHRLQLMFADQRPHRSAVDYRGYVSIASGIRACDAGTPERHFYLDLTNGQLHSGALCHHSALRPIPDIAGVD